MRSCRRRPANSVSCSALVLTIDRLRDRHTTIIFAPSGLLRHHVSRHCVFRRTVSVWKSSVVRALSRSRLAHKNFSNMRAANNRSTACMAMRRPRRFGVLARCSFLSLPHSALAFQHFTSNCSTSRANRFPLIVRRPLTCKACTNTSTRTVRFVHWLQSRFCNAAVRSPAKLFRVAAALVVFGRADGPGRRLSKTQVRPVLT